MFMWCWWLECFVVVVDMFIVSGFYVVFMGVLLEVVFVEEVCGYMC